MCSLTAQLFDWTLFLFHLQIHAVNFFHFQSQFWLKFLVTKLQWLNLDLFLAQLFFQIIVLSNKLLIQLTLIVIFFPLNLASLFLSGFLKIETFPIIRLLILPLICIFAFLRRFFDLHTLCITRYGLIKLFFFLLQILFHHIERLVYLI